MGERKTPILLGLKHCGKSTLGALAGRRWAMDFRDLDDWLLKLAGEEVDPPPASCRDLYQRSAEEFRRWEYLAAKAVAEEMAKSPMIIALGGGAVENTKALGVLQPRGTLIYLKEEEEVLYRRILSGGIPPFLDAGNPRKSWEEVYRRRHELCKQKADIILPLKGANPERSLELLAWALDKTG